MPAGGGASPAAGPLTPRAPQEEGSGAWRRRRRRGTAEAAAAAMRGGGGGGGDVQATAVKNGRVNAAG